MTAVSSTPQQITATLRTHRDRTINMIIKQQHNQHTLNNAPLPRHSITAHKQYLTTTSLVEPRFDHHSHRRIECDERQSADRGRRAEQRVRQERHKASREQYERKQSTVHILNADKQHRQQQLQHQHRRDSQLPAHLTAARTTNGVGVEEWRRRVREEREAIEAEEGQMMERVQQMKQRIVQLQAEERAEEERQQHDTRRRHHEEATQRAMVDEKRDEKQRWVAALTSAPTHYVREERSAPLSSDSSSDSSHGGEVRREEDTAAEMTRLWDEFKHKWTPPKQPSSSAPPTQLPAPVAAESAEKESAGDLHSLTASTDASIRELTVMLNDMIKEFNITAAAVGDEKPIVPQTTQHKQVETVWAGKNSKQHTEEVMAAASAASVTSATAAINVTARKPSPLSSPSSSPTRLNTAQRQRSAARGEAQEAEWHLILQELKHDKPQLSEQTATAPAEGRVDGGGRVGLFVPTIFNKREERKRAESKPHRAAQEEQEEEMTDGKEPQRKRAPTAAEFDVNGEDGADGVVYSGLIDFDVNDPHEIDRQRRIEAQLVAETTARQQQQSKKQPQQAEERERQSTVSDERVREAINRYKRSGLAAEEIDEKKESAGMEERTSEMQSKSPQLDSTVDVRQWLERLERKIDALANQQPHLTAVQGENKAQRSTKRKATGTQPAADIFAPVQQPEQQQEKHHNEKGRELHKQQSASTTEPASSADTAWSDVHTQRDNQRRTDNDKKYASDVQPQPPPTRTDRTSAYAGTAPSSQPFVTTTHSASSHSQQRSSVIGAVDGGGGSAGSGLTLQECFARRMGHIIATNEQRRHEREQHRLSLAHARCTADDDYSTAARHSSLSHTRPASQPSHRTGRRRYGASFQSSAASATPGVAVSSGHLRMQLGGRAVIGAREARARSARVWRQLPEVHRRREEQKKREERRRSVERRQSYDKQRRAGQR